MLSLLSLESSDSSARVKTLLRVIKISHSQELMNKNNIPPTWEKKTDLLWQRGWEHTISKWLAKQNAMGSHGGKKQLITHICFLKIHILLLSLPSPAHSIHILPGPTKRMFVYLKKPHALADSVKQMFCVISERSRKCLFITPRKTTPCSKTLFSA